MNGTRDSGLGVRKSAFENGSRVVVHNYRDLEVSGGEDPRREIVTLHPEPRVQIPNSRVPIPESRTPIPESRVPRAA